MFDYSEIHNCIFLSDNTALEYTNCEKPKERTVNVFFLHGCVNLIN